MERDKKKTIFNNSLAILVGILTAVLSAVILTLFSISAPNIVCVDSAPKPPELDSKIENGKTIFHIRIKPKFKNRGFKSGYIKNVEIHPVALKQFPEIKVIYFEKSKLKWLEEREILCEFLVIFDPIQNRIFNGPFLEFKACFLGEDGNELYWQGIRILAEEFL